MTRLREIRALLFEHNIPEFYLWDDETLAKLDRDYVILTDPKPSAVLSAIRELVTKAHDTISSLDGFSYEVPSRDTDEAEFEPNLKQMCLKRGKVRKYDVGTLGSARKATILTAVLSFIQEGLLKNISIFGRTLFYRDPKLFGKPEVVDDAVFDICCMLRCSRGHLGVRASSRGLFIGGVTLVMKDGNPISGRLNSAESVQVPVHTENIIEIMGEISYVLVVEKQTVFHHLAQQRYHDKNNCVIVTGSGEPDMSTRSFVFKLSKITPTIYGLFDADPYGATIYCTYKFGSARLSFNNFGLIASSMIWIGVSFNDLIDRVDKSLLVPLTETDMTMLNNMCTKVYAMEDFAFRFHIFRMKNEKLKGEVECLHSLGLDVLYNYVSTAIELARARAGMEEIHSQSQDEISVCTTGSAIPDNQLTKDSAPSNKAKKTQDFVVYALCCS